MDTIKKISGQILDIVNKRIYSGEICITNGRISKITEKLVAEDYLIAPGFVDAHIHIESSMLTPQNFAAEAVKHGTIGVVCDPHEIANILGITGVEYMVKNAGTSALKFYFGAPSCVPATSFESNGAVITSNEIDKLFQNNITKFLAEVMNFPGVIYDDPLVLEKIKVAKKYGKRIDGHAPGLIGDDLRKYIKSGILTDHECEDFNEALEKITYGMYIQIREGSAAKNFNDLFSLINSHNDNVMLCSDDLHPDDLIKGHINLLVKRAIQKNVDIFNAWRAASFNPVKFYDLDIGLLQVNDPADFIVLKNSDPEEVQLTIINGKVVYNKSDYHYQEKQQKLINYFKASKIKTSDIAVHDRKCPVRIIKAFDGKLFTEQFIAIPKINSGYLVSDVKNDLLKLCVVNRYKPEKPSVAFINGFGLKTGALAGSIAHDSHNIIAVGVNDDQISEVINWIIDNNGGIAVHDGSDISGIPLPIAGIISDKSAKDVADSYLRLNNITKKIGCHLTSPFMTLSFMSLLVIPELKLSDKGLFDVKKFSFTDLYTS